MNCGPCVLHHFPECSEHSVCWNLITWFAASPTVLKPLLSRVYNEHNYDFNRRVVTGV
jgi:hypothetical protein